MPPRLSALFHRQIEGDDALYRLAQARFAQGNLLPEFNPHSPDNLEREWQFHPLPDQPACVHLPRGLQLLTSKGQDTICAFMERFGKRANVMVVHDQWEIESRKAEYVAAVRQLDDRLRKLGAGPTLYIEYAVGLPPSTFVQLFETIRDCRRISACVDISHVGIRQCQLAYQERHLDQDICHLKWHHPSLPERVADVQAVCATALPVVCQTVAALAQLGKPLHFHLHDGHPASTFSRFGVSDHLSFFQTIPIPFSYQGERNLPLLFGPLGLKKILDTVRSALPDEQITLTIEVHAPDGRLDLGEHAELFAHWREKENAERMNYWIEVLLRCARLAREACEG